MPRILTLPHVLTVRGAASAGRYLLRPRAKIDAEFVLPDDIWSTERWADLTAAIDDAGSASVAAGDFRDPSIDLVWMGRDLQFFTALNRPYAITSPASNILRFETRDNDFAWSGDQGNNYVRAEVTSTTRYSKTAVYWWSFAFKVEAGAAIGAHCMVGQMHGADLSGYPRQPITAMVLANDVMRIRTQYSTDPTSAGTATHRVPSVATVPRDTWVNMVIEEKQGTGDGYINVWRDGQQVVSATGSLGYINDASGPNFQIGTYRSNDGSNLGMQIANWEFGVSDLTGRIASPLAI